MLPAASTCNLPQTAKGKLRIDCRVLLWTWQTQW